MTETREANVTTLGIVYEGEGMILLTQGEGPEGTIAGIGLTRSLQRTK